MGQKGARIVAGVASLALLSLSGCMLGPRTAGVPGFARGVITSKSGSIWVNGVEYQAAGARVTINGVSNGSIADLRVGMVVSVRGSIDQASGTGVATAVEFHNTLEGPIESVDQGAGTFVVLGQTVAVDASTVFEGVAGLAGLQAGNLVEVSGVAGPSGAIQATFVELKISAEHSDVSGTVSDLGATSFTLTVPESGAVFTVEYTGTLGPGIVNGSLVEVSFISISGSTISTTADQVTLEGSVSPEDSDRVEVSGLVKDFTATATGATFTVEGMSVSAPSALLSGVADGVEVEVEGTLTSGVILASSIEVEQETAEEGLSGNAAGPR